MLITLFAAKDIGNYVSDVDPSRWEEMRVAIGKEIGEDVSVETKIPFSLLLKQPLFPGEAIHLLHAAIDGAERAGALDRLSEFLRTMISNIRNRHATATEAARTAEFYLNNEALFWEQSTQLDVLATNAENELTLTSESVPWTAEETVELAGRVAVLEWLVEPRNPRKAPSASVVRTRAEARAVQRFDAVLREIAG